MGRGGLGEGQSRGIFRRRSLGPGGQLDVAEEGEGGILRLLPGSCPRVGAAKMEVQC